MLLEHSNADPYNVQAQVVAAVWEFKENLTYGADFVHWTIMFGPVTQHLRGYQFYGRKNLGA
jgi:hypothetical protein